MSKKFICIIDWGNYEKIIENNILGVKYLHRGQINNVNIGDKLLFYIKAGKYQGDKKDSSIIGAFEIISDVFSDETRIFKGTENFPLRVKIKRIEKFKEPKNFRPLISKLQVIKNKEKWGMLFWGRAIIEVNNHDYNLILDYLK